MVNCYRILGLSALLLSRAKLPPATGCCCFNQSMVPILSTIQCRQPTTTPYIQRKRPSWQKWGEEGVRSFLTWRLIGDYVNPRWNRYEIRSVFLYWQKPKLGTESYASTDCMRNSENPLTSIGYGSFLTEAQAPTTSCNSLAVRSDPLWANITGCLFLDGEGCLVYTIFLRRVSKGSTMFPK